MLAILSEINCLTRLNALGIYPDEFYTDIEKFKNNLAFFRETTVLVIFAGNCSFNKKHTVELVKTIMKRKSMDNDIGFKAVYVISDIELESLSSYYKYSGDLETVDIMSGTKVVKPDVNIWVKLKSEPKNSKLFLSSYDLGDSSEAHQAYANRHKAEDEYVRLIQVPNVKNILETS